MKKYSNSFKNSRFMNKLDIFQSLSEGMNKNPWSIHS